MRLVNQTCLKPTFGLAAFAGAMMLLSNSGQAASFETAYQGFCDKMKSCALVEINKAGGMNETMKAQAALMIEGMCVNVRDDFNSVTQHPALEPASIECLSSMAALSCEDLASHSGADTTPQCKLLQSKAKAIGARFGQ